MPGDNLVLWTVASVDWNIEHDGSGMSVNVFIVDAIGVNLSDQIGFIVLILRKDLFLLTLSSLTMMKMMTFSREFP